MQAFPRLLAVHFALFIFVAAACAESPRDIHQLALVGNETIPTDKIIECLSKYPAVLAAAEKVNSEDDFVRVVEETLRAGYQKVGFTECKVQVERADAGWKATIIEGPRILLGAIRIQGNDETVQWLQKSIATFQADPNKVIWLEGKPWNGDFKVEDFRQNNLNECLGALGVNPRYVSRSIQIEKPFADSPTSAVLVLDVPSSVKPTRLEDIRCDSPDRDLVQTELARHGITIGKNVDPTTAIKAQQILLSSTMFDVVKCSITNAHGLGDVVLNVQASQQKATGSKVDVANAALARQKLLNFAEQLKRLATENRGLFLTMTAAELQLQLWLGEHEFGFQVDNAGKELVRFYNSAETDTALVRANDGTRYAFGIPNLSLRLGAAFDKDAEKKIATQFNTDFQSDESKRKPNRFEVDLISLCSIFPLEQSRCVETADGFVIESSRGRLQLDTNGLFQSLALHSEEPDSVWLLEAIDLASVPDKIRSLAVNQNDKLAFQFPSTPPSDSLNDLTKFYVHRDGRDLTAAWTFWLIHETLHYQPGTAIYSLAEIFSISSAGDRPHFDPHVIAGWRITRKVLSAPWPWLTAMPTPARLNKPSLCLTNPCRCSRAAKTCGRIWTWHLSKAVHSEMQPGN